MAAVTTITLDFTTSYRAITDTDLQPFMTRDPFGWDGKGAPQAAVTYVDDKGIANTFPATNPLEPLPAFYLNHAPSSNQLDLISLLNETVLHFDVPVDGAPIWENYVDALYTGEAGLAQWNADTAAYSTAYASWTNYVLTHEFRASAAAYSDKGGALAQFTSTGDLLVEDFTTAPEFFAVNIMGSAFSDTFGGGELNDTLSGAQGNDKVLGQGGDDFISGGSGDDTVDGQTGDDTIFGDAGADTMAGEAGNDALAGATGNDLGYGGAGNDELLGAAGNDLLHGGANEDTLNGGTAADLLYGDDGNDALVGASDDDTLNGGAGKDSLWGGAGDDALSGGDGNDSLMGGDGNDFLRGGVGKDTLTGDGGNDTFLFNATGAANADRITDFNHLVDKIGLERGTFPGVHAALDAQEFRFGTTALDGDDRIIYDAASGRLWYDPDGTRNGVQSAPQVLFAVIANHVFLTSDDFVVI